MKLKRIKIAGFKSFADSITIHVPGAMSGIVGPNGSGKSNVVDAVRWVAGESSAKSLRGATLVDVIFNGSQTRKPAGRASVELLFDNSSGRFPGQWAKFAEISIRRTLTRDTVSEYFINGTRSRRRDVTELFLGTGFGPRSYSIVEQGMISRIIEAKPEELGAFVEEASGISRFREKRHETLLKLRRTRDNLERLGDMRSEVEQRLRRLKYQSDQAKRYETMKERARGLLVRLLTVDWSRLSERIASIESESTRLDVEKQKRTAAVRSIEADLEKARKSQLEMQNRLSDVQMEKFRINTEISRIEQQVEHSDAGRRRDRSDLESMQAEATLLENSIVELQRRLQANTRECENLDQKLDSALADLSERQRMLADSERSLEESMSELERIDRQVIKAVRRREATHASLEEVTRSKAGVDSTLLELRSETERLDRENETDSTASLQAAVAELSERCKDLENQLTEAELSVSGKRALQDQYIHELEQFRENSKDAQIRLLALERTLASVTTDEDGFPANWVLDNNLENAPIISSHVTVEEGWERVVDRVLGNKLTAVRVDNIEPVALNLNESPGTAVYLVDGSPISMEPQSSWPALADFVSSADRVVEGMLAGVYVADSMADALRMRARLKGNECVVTAQGAMVGGNWFSPALGDAGSSGVLETSNLIRKYRGEVNQNERNHANRIDQIEANRQQVSDLDVRCNELRTTLAENTRKLQSLQSELNQLQSDRALATERMEQTRVRLTKTESFERSLVEKIERLSEQVEFDFKACEDVENEKLNNARDARLLKERTRELQESVNSAISQRHQIELDVQKARSDRDSHAASMMDLSKRLEQIQKSQTQLQEKIALQEDPTVSLRQQIDQLVKERIANDDKLSRAHETAEQSESGYREMDKRRVHLQMAVEETNNEVQDRKVKAGELSVQCREIKNKIEQYGLTPDEEIKNIEDNFDYEQESRRLEKLQRRIDNVGPINLTAIEEYDQESQRKEFMDNQHADLTRAVETLEATIAKIDAESKERFYETFNIVNSNYQRLLPALFGGGSGHIEIVGDYPENAGLSVFARPKGKRINSIQSLSGGEKALTAVVLLLSFFQLNPSPICLLDEIDAPLDDDNVYRLCKNLREFSEVTQLMLITHNKITMESVDTLIGVSMPEPNVSRMLSVNLQEAQEFAA